MAQQKGGKGAGGSKGTSRPPAKASTSAPSAARGGSASGAAKSTGTSKPKGATTRRSTSSAKPGNSSSKPGASVVVRKQAEEETKTYRSKAEKYKNDREATDKLLKDAQEKAKKQKGPLSGRFDDITTLIRLVGAYFKGDYRDVPWETIALAIGALIYFLSPVDLIPDPIPIVGYIDDAAVIGFVVASIYVDLNNFRDWEEAQKAG